MAFDSREQRATPEDHAGLWSAEQLVGGETDNIDTCREAFWRRWLMRHAPLRRVEERAAAEVMDVLDASGVRGGGELRKSGRFGETDDAKVARMYAEKR